MTSICQNLTLFLEVFKAPKDKPVNMAQIQNEICAAIEDFDISRIVQELLNNTRGLDAYTKLVCYKLF